MLGLLIAALGLVAVFAVLRTRWRVRHSLYDSLRAERQRQVEEARGRALGAGTAAGESPPRVIDSQGGLTVRETTAQVLAGHAALAVALLLVLLGVVVLVGATR